MADARVACIDVGDIAEVAAAVLTSAGHEGRTYRLTGPEVLDMADVAERLSTATGRPVRYVYPPEDARKAQHAASVPQYTADALFELFAERRRGKEAQVWPDSETIFGLRPTSFQEFATRHAAIFRGEEPPPKV
jgi:uncharacterized protein YbjT (DUF2867 family)